MSEKEIPVTQEHQGVPSTSSSNTDYVPTTEERIAIKLVESLFSKAKNQRKKYDEHWLDDYKMFRGKQWKEERPSYRHSEVINFIFQAIQSVIPILTDTRPKFDYLPQEPQDMEVAKILSEVSTSDWESGNWLMVVAEMLYESHFYGTGLFHMGFDPNANYGAGKILFESVDPFCSYPDPAASDVNDRKSKYFIHAEPVDIDVLKKEYPDKKDYIKADVTDLMQGDKTDLSQVKYKSPVDNRLIVEGNSAYDAATRDRAIKVTCYMHCDEFDEEEVLHQNPDGSSDVSYVQKKKYPNGRKICIVNGVVLSDGPIPFDDGLFPYGRLLNYMDPRSFWGISEIEQLRSPQKIFNKLVSFSLDVLTLMGNPIWVIDKDADIDTDNLFNRPGLVVEKEKGSEVTRHEGVQLQPFVLQLIDRMATWFDGISGANDITRGVNPTGVTAAAAISDLQDAAQTRTRQKSRHLDACLQNAGKMYMNRAFQFYTAPRVIRLTNDQNAARYFKFSVDNIQDEGGNNKKLVRVIDYNQDQDGKYSESSQVKEFIVNGDFDVRVNTGSSLPFAKTQKANLAFKLFETGAIDQLELLQAVEYPNYEAVWREVQQRQQQAAANAPQPAPKG